MKKVLSFLMVFSLVILAAFAPNSSYAQENGDTLTLNESVKSAEKALDLGKYVSENEIKVNDSTKEELLKKAKELIDSGKIEPKSISNLNPDKLEVKAVNTGDNIEYSVFITSVKTDDEQIISSLELFNIVFNKDLEMKNTYEMNAVKNKENFSTTKFWIDGKLINTLKMDLNDVINNSISEETGNSIVNNTVAELEAKSDNGEDKTFHTAGWSKRWKCTQSCVASKGVNMLVFGALVGVCGVACTAGVPATAGTACYACVNSAGILGVNTILNCLEKCDY